MGGVMGHGRSKDFDLQFGYRQWWVGHEVDRMNGNLYLQRQDGVCLWASR